MLGYHCGYCHSYLTVLLLFGAITDNVIGYAVLSMALPFFLTFSFAVHRELYSSQKGVALISKGVCLYPNDEKPEEFIRRLK